jgi:hypothetical protein
MILTNSRVVDAAFASSTLAPTAVADFEQLIDDTSHAGARRQLKREPCDGARESKSSIANVL